MKLASVDLAEWLNSPEYSINSGFLQLDSEQVSAELAGLGDDLVEEAESARALKVFWNSIKTHVE